MPLSKSASSRRAFLHSTLATGAAVALHPALGAAREITPPPKSSGPDVKPFELEEVTIAELQGGMKSGRFTAHSLTEKYLQRIDEIYKRGPAINAIIELNPD